MKYSLSEDVPAATATATSVLVSSGSRGSQEGRDPSRPGHVAEVEVELTHIITEITEAKAK